MSKIVSTLYKVDLERLSYLKEGKENNFECIKRIVCKPNDDDTDDESRVDRKNIKIPFELNGKGGEHFLYVYKGNYPIVWERFLGGIANFGNAELFNIVHSFVLVVFEERDFYILTAGYGHFNVSSIVDDRFGLDVLERLYTDADAQIMSFQKRAVVGNILGEIVAYRHPTSAGAESNPAKIVNRSIFHIEKKLLDDILRSSVDRNYSVTASAGLKIAKSLSFPEFKTLIKGTHELLKKDIKMSLDKMKPIKDEQLIEGFNGELVVCLLDVLNGKKDSSDIAFINRNFMKYLTATSREVKRGHRVIIEKADPDIELLEVLRAIHREFPLTVSNAMDVISKVKIKSYLDNERNYLSHSDLYDHISLECVYKDKKGFLLESKWYEFDVDLIQALHDEIALKCSELVDDDLLNKGWKTGRTNKKVSKEKESEGEYNLSYIDEPDYIVLDTLLHKRIELCDLLVLKDDLVYFVHVKRGFGSSIRELSSQILNSAYLASLWGGTSVQEVKEEMRMFYQKIENLYKDEGVELESRLTFDDFTAAFTDKRKFVFCLAYSDRYKDKATDKGFLGNLNKYQSAIAKMSLLDAFNGVNEHGFKFKIARIEEI